MRRRKHHLGLPKRVYVRHGAYYYVTFEGRWHRLCSVSDGEPRMLKEHLRVVMGEGRESHAGDLPPRIDEFLASHLPELKPETRKEYRRIFTVIATAFREFSVAQVTPKDIIAFLSQWASKRTAQRAYKARLSTFFSWCVVADLRSDNPCREVELKKAPVRDRYITHLEFAYASEALVRMKGGAGSWSGRMMRALFDLAYLTAQRCPDVRTVQWRHVTDDGIYFKPTKTEGTSGAKVLIPRTVQIEEVLDRLRELRMNRSPFVVHQRDGSEYTASALRSAWRRARPHAIAAYRRDCLAQGIEADPAFLNGATVRDLRAKTLTDAEREGYSLEQLKVMAAHTKISTTEKYFKERRVAVSRVVMSLPRKASRVDSRPKNGLDDDSNP